MIYKLLAFFLGFLVVAESIYILTHRHSANRFKAVADFSAVVALDSATGQLCKTLRTGSPATGQRPTGSPNPPPGQPSDDPVIDEIRTMGAKGQAEQGTLLDFVRELPACADIH